MSKSHVFIINGKPRSGKDSVCELTQEVVGGEFIVRNISTVDLVKDAAAALGWEGDKTEAWRSMLHEIKMLWSSKFDGPFSYIAEQVLHYDADPSDHIVFVHSREPEEIARFKERFGSRCHTLLIRRKNSEDADNPADMNVEKYEYDHVIYNPESPDWQHELRAAIDLMLQETIIGGC